MAMLVAAVMTTQPATAQVQLVYANGWPRDQVQVGVVADEWIRRVEAVTEGRVKIRHVAGGTLLKGEGILDGVRKRVADCGPLVPAYNPGALPISTILLSAIDIETGSKLDIKGIAEINNKLFAEFPAFRAEFDKLGVRGVLWVPTAPYAIISKKPTTSLSDLDGQKLRGFGKIVPRFEAAMGAVPVAVANTEMYTSIQTGVIDGAMTDPPLMLSSKLYEVAKHVLLTGPGMGIPLAGASVVYICNEDSWKRISEADRELIAKATADMSGYISTLMQETAETALRELKTKGVTVSRLSAAEVDTLRAKTPFFAEAAKELDSQGLPGTEMVKRYRELAQEYAGRSRKP